MEEDEQRLRVRLVGSDGRRRYDPVSVNRLVAACLEPGVSVSRLALEHGVNVNLLRKWIRKATSVHPVPLSSTSAFVPVQVGTDRALPMQSSALETHATPGGERRLKPERIDFLSFPAKVSASLPNGVNLTLECGDVDALAAIIGALGDVQARR
ncbi:IS66-like element accessory protein TnpA [Ensifer adhaerens]|uniref:IS66-like element accessory protein TnpA n=1 Tax=Ensifer adhaerens TaxID=106592 RepID=UPI000DD71CB4|nr:transposase [Ensifer adhaerens]